MSIMAGSKTRVAKQNVTAKADEAKAIKRNKNRIRIKPDRQQDKTR
jgi:hypothetical protein